MSGLAWLGQAETDRREDVAIEQYVRARLETRLAEAQADGWLTPDEVREALGRPRKRTVSGPAAPSKPAAPPASGDVGAAPETSALPLRALRRIRRLP